MYMEIRLYESLLYYNYTIFYYDFLLECLALCNEKGRGLLRGWPGWGWLGTTNTIAATMTMTTATIATIATTIINAITIITAITSTCGWRWPEGAGGGWVGLQRGAQGRSKGQRGTQRGLPCK